MTNRMHRTPISKKTPGWRALFLVLASLPAPAGADYGLGVVFGEPTGFTFKHRIDEGGAADAGLAFSLSSFVVIYGDYLWHFPRAFAPKGRVTQLARELTPYAGVGGVIFFSTNSARSDVKYFTGSGASAGLGVRIPLGVEWRPERPSIGVFVELVPGIGVIPSTFGFLEGGIGIRYYF